MNSRKPLGVKSQNKRHVKRKPKPQWDVSQVGRLIVTNYNLELIVLKQLFTFSRSTKAKDHGHCPLCAYFHNMCGQL